MKTTFRLLTGALVASLLTASAAMAHHSFAMFDRSIEKVTTGTVARWQFNAPHSWLYLNVKNADGTQTLWSFEGSAPQSLLTRGISGSTFEPGATVTVSFCPMKDGRPAGGIGWAKLANGTFVNPSDGGCDGSEKAIERWKPLLAKGITSSAGAQK
jgi:hypothetical protein